MKPLVEDTGKFQFCKPRKLYSKFPQFLQQIHFEILRSRSQSSGSAQVCALRTLFNYLLSRWNTNIIGHTCVIMLTHCVKSFINRSENCCGFWRVVNAADPVIIAVAFARSSLQLRWYFTASSPQHLTDTKLALKQTRRRTLAYRAATWRFRSQLKQNRLRFSCNKLTLTTTLTWWPWAYVARFWEMQSCTRCQIHRHCHNICLKIVHRRRNDFNIAGGNIFMRVGLCISWVIVYCCLSQHT